LEANQPGLKKKKESIAGAEGWRGELTGEKKGGVSNRVRTGQGEKTSSNAPKEKHVQLSLKKERKNPFVGEAKVRLWGLLGMKEGAVV